MIYSKEMMKIGKVIEIIILLIGIVLIIKNITFGVFLVSLIIFDWLLSPFVEKKNCGDYFYSWKCLFNIEKSNEQNK